MSIGVNYRPKKKEFRSLCDKFAISDSVSIWGDGDMVYPSLSVHNVFTILQNGENGDANE